MATFKKPISNRHMIQNLISIFKLNVLEIFLLFSSMVDRRDFSEAKLSPEMEGITQAFTYGRDAESFGTEDACAPLRSKCLELQNKKQKYY